MDVKSVTGLFRTRNILGAALVVGICAGVYLGDLFKGFGLGPGSGFGTGSTKQGQNSSSSSKASNDGVDESNRQNEEIVANVDAEDFIKIVIDKRAYLLRTSDGEKPISLAKIVELTKAAKGDDDGIRIRIYRKLTARTQSEEDLKDALNAAEIPEKQRLFMPTPEQ